MWEALKKIIYMRPGIPDTDVSWYFFLMWNEQTMTMFLKYIEGLFERVAFKEIGYLLRKNTFRIPANSLLKLLIQKYRFIYFYKLKRKPSLWMPK